MTVGTTLSGEMTDIAVTDWIKNPDELDQIGDISTLDNLTADDDVSYARDGDELTWDADGCDVSYTGTTSQELPFDISYSYKLDGEKLDPDELTNLTGTLKVTIRYENLSTATIDVDGTEEEVPYPYLFASIVTLDTEHVRDVTVVNGTTVDYSGSLIAVGVGMPGLGEALGVEDMVEFPDKVTFKAEVAGFDMASIMTVVTDQALASIDGDTTDDIEGTLDDLFSQTDAITEALETLADGMDGVDTAIATIAEGQSKLNEALPTATDGISALDAAGEGLSQIQAGYEGLEEGMETVNAATSALTEATGAMSSQVTEMLDEVQVTAGDIVDRVSAVAELAGSSSAFCGSADDMPASTLFVVTASA